MVPATGSEPVAGTERRACGVSVVNWPSERVALASLQRAGTPRLLLVEDGHQPPLAGDCCQDWMWRSGPECEKRARAHQLSLRAFSHGHLLPVLDDIGMLYFGLRSIHLPPKEAAIVDALLRTQPGVLSAEALVAAAWPSGITGPSVLASRLSRLRERLAWLGLELHGSRRQGYALVAGSASDQGPPAGFEQELPGSWGASGAR